MYTGVTRLCLSLLMLFFLLEANAQTKRKYFSENDYSSSEEEATYFIKDTLGTSNNPLSIKGYYLTGELFGEFVFSSGTRNGEYKKYYKTGKRLEVGTFKDGNLLGEWSRYFINGVIDEKRIYCGEECDIEPLETMYKFPFAEKFTIIEKNDSLGESLVNSGNGYLKRELHKGVIESGQLNNGRKEGEWKGYATNENLLFVENFESGVLKTGTSYDSLGNEYTYEIIDVQAELKVPMERYLKNVGSATKYTRLARRKGIEGRVCVQFVVNKVGGVDDVLCVKGIGFGLDETAEEAVKACSEDVWKPGLIRGQRVRQKMILPISFKLN